MRVKLDILQGHRKSAKQLAHHTVVSHVSAQSEGRYQENFQRTEGATCEYCHIL